MPVSYQSTTVRRWARPALGGRKPPIQTRQSNGTLMSRRGTKSLYSVCGQDQSEKVSVVLKISPSAPTTKGRKLLTVRGSWCAGRLRRRSEEGPARQVCQGCNCGLAESAKVASSEIARNPRTNLGNLFQRNAALLPTVAAAALGPIDRVGEHDEGDHGVARGFRETATCRRRQSRARRRRWLQRYYRPRGRPTGRRRCRSGEGVANQRESEEGDGPEREDGGDGEGRVFVVGIDGSLGGDDCGTPQMEEPTASRPVSFAIRRRGRGCA